jgi:hypothetical protein
LILDAMDALEGLANSLFLSFNFDHILLFDCREKKKNGRKVMEIYHQSDAKEKSCTITWTAILPTLTQADPL